MLRCGLCQAIEVIVKEEAAGLPIRYKANREPQDAERTSVKGRETSKLGLSERSKIAVAWRPGLGQVSALHRYSVNLQQLDALGATHVHGLAP